MKKILITEEQLKNLIRIDELRYVKYTNEIDGTPFVLHKGILYMFDNKNSNGFIQQLTNLIYDLNMKVQMPDSVNDCYDILEYDLRSNPEFIAGHFSISKENKIKATFYLKTNLNVMLSTEFIKMFEEMKGIQEFNFNDENKIYTREEMLSIVDNTKKQTVPLPEYLYHGTNSDNIKTILLYGIRPGRGQSNFGKVIHNNHVFMAASFNTAKGYSEVSVAKKTLSAKKVVIKINTNKIDKDKITYDFDMYNGYVGKGNVAYDNLNQSLFKDINTSNRPLQSKSNQNPGARYNKLGYEGIVMPAAIESIFIEESFGKFNEYTPQEYKNKFIDNVTENIIKENKEPLSLPQLKEKFPNMIFTMEPKNDKFFVKAEIKTQGGKIEYLGAIKGFVNEKEAIEFLNNKAMNNYDKYY